MTIAKTRRTFLGHLTDRRRAADLRDNGETIVHEVSPPCPAWCDRNGLSHMPEPDGTVHHDAVPRTVPGPGGGALHVAPTRHDRDDGAGPVRIRLSDDRRAVVELDAPQVRDLARALLESVEACYDAPAVLYAAR